MSLSQYASKPGTEAEKDESYKCLVDKRNIPETGKGSLYFRILGFKDEDFHHGMEYWLNLGHNPKTNKPLSLPRVSAIPFSEFVSQNERTGAVYVSWKAATKKCILAKLTEDKHPLIAQQSFNGQEPKPNVAAFHAARIQLIELVRDKDNKVVKDEKGVGKVRVIAEERLLKMTQGWWDQFVRLVEGDSTASSGEDDGLGSAPSAPAKVFPTKDLTKVLWMLTKKVRTVNPNPNPKLNVDYVLDFSDKVVLTDVPECPEPPIEFTRVFKPLANGPELKELLKKHDLPDEAHRDASSYGESLDGDDAPAGTPLTAEQQKALDEVEAGF